jgi:predicted nucleic acid-binding protein
VKSSKKKPQKLLKRFLGRVARLGREEARRIEGLLEPYVIIESDRKLCQWWAAITDQVRRGGWKIQSGDAWIAATALLYNLPLVTHNAADFADVSGLTVISEPDE